MNWLIRAMSLVALVAALPAHALTNGFSKPYMGYVNYYWFGYTFTAASLSVQANCMNTNGMQAAGYNYFDIDWRWSDGTVDENGVPIADPAKFPSGMAAFADYIHGLGQKLGLYAVGDLTGAGYYEGIGGYWTNAMNYWSTNYQIDHIKFDFLNRFYYPPIEDTIQPEDQATRMMGAVLGCGRPVIYSIVNFPVTSWQPAVCNYGRTTEDTQGGWANTLTRCDDFHSASGYYTNGFIPDPEYLAVGRTSNAANPPVSILTANEERSNFALFCVMGVPLVVSFDLTVITPTQLALLTHSELIAINQDDLIVPGTRKSRTAGSGGNKDIWSKPLTNGMAVACMNGTDGATTFTVDLSTVEFPTNVARVRDAFARVDLGIFTNTFTTESVASHDTAVFTLLAGGGNGSAIISAGTVRAGSIRPP